MLPFDEGVAVVGVVALVVAALACALCAVVVWRRATRFTASTAQRIGAIQNLGFAAAEHLAATRAEVSRIDGVALSSLRALPELDARLGAAHAGLRQRRAALDETRVTLLARQDLVARVKLGWRAIQQMRELGRVLGW